MENTTPKAQCSNPIAPNDQLEFVGQIIDIFEDFLDEQGIDVPNHERNEGVEDEDESLAKIYGTHYGQLQSRLESMMISWGIFKKDASEDGGMNIT